MGRIGRGNPPRNPPPRNPPLGNPPLGNPISRSALNKAAGGNGQQDGNWPKSGTARIKDCPRL